MKKAIFSSIDGGQSHRKLILSHLGELHMLARSSSDPIVIQIMAFAFTDSEIAAALEDLAAECRNIQISIIADWSQGAPKSPSVVPDLASGKHGRIALKYKLDLPYYMNRSTGRVSWGYHTSHGMLHHKTLLIIRAGRAESLILGSFNWGMRGAASYENTMLVSRDAASGDLLDAFRSEFDAMWNDPALTVFPAVAAELAIMARRKVQAGGSLHDLDDLREVLGSRASDAMPRRNIHVVDGAILPAFSGRHLTSRAAHFGFSARNNARNLNLLRPSGQRKPAPCSVNAVALEAIRSVPSGAPIKVAMYAMSKRVPEYAALLDAARRGCPVSVLLDRKIGKGFGEDLAARAQSERLPIEVRGTNRRMHQKYLVAPQCDMVVTGTANMTLDSASRHAEHRILFRNDAHLCEKFAQDFATIWERVA